MRTVALLLILLAGEARADGSSVSSLDLMDVDLLFVGAHPDDDSGVFATFARYGLDEGHRTAVVTLTGGEAGGNATGPESGRALGLVRREEEERALALAGVSATHFLGLTDFHFTLSAEEAQARWGSAFVCDVVRIVRLRRPEVIVTMWPGPGTHGQHQMAARAATLAFARAGDPAFCPDQVTGEGVRPFAPAKLYYADSPRGRSSLQVPTDAFSPAARQRYADLRALAIMQYRSQGYDLLQKVPSPDLRPEEFLLVRSRVPVEDPETHMLAGALRPAGTSPPGVRLEASAPYRVPAGGSVEVTVTLTNGTAVPFADVALAVEAPAGWTAGAPAPVGPVAPGAQASARIPLTAGPGAVLDANTRLHATYRATAGADVLTGANPVVLRAVAPVSVSFRPRFDVAGYRDFARESGTEWVIETLPARVPLPMGETADVLLDVDNAGAEPARGEIGLDLPPGVRAMGPVRFEVAAQGHATAVARLAVDPAALPSGRHAVLLPLRASVPGGGRDAADAYVLPAVTIPRVPRAPTIDGDLSDLQGLAAVDVGPADRWWRKEPDGPEDLSAHAVLGFDARALYVGVHVRDQAVVCNIAPDDVRSQLRSDAVGITIDPTGSSHDTGTTLQAAAFPCTTAGWGARAFRDGDARAGLAEDTAPGLRVASRRTDDGYDLEWAIPWAVLPVSPGPGAVIGLNLVLYDGDQTDARPGANISETGLAWAAFDWGGKQALPYLWGRARLGK